MVRNFVIIVLVLAVLAGCAQKQESVPTDPGVVRIGVDSTYRPFEFVDSATGQLDGFDIDLITEICRINDWQYEFIPTPFQELISGLVEKRFDLAIGALTITPQRKVQVAFSDPYYLAGQCIVVPEQDSVTAGLADLRGKRVGVQSQSTGQDLAKRTDGALVYSFKTAEAAFLALLAGELDAVVNDLPAVREFMGRHDGARIVKAAVKAEYYGVAVRLDDLPRLREINHALALLFGDGRYESLHMKWFSYPPLDLPVADSGGAA